MPEVPRINKRVSTLIGLHVLLFFLIPYLPRSVLILTDNILIRLALLAAIIAAAYVSPLVAVSTFIVIAFLFIERNKVKIHHLEKVMQQSTMDSPAIESIQTPETAPEQPAFDIPIVDSVPFMPQNDSGDDSFAPVAETINEKVPLPTEGSNDGSRKAINQLFSWVNPTPAQSPP
jgi:hypothetical protein